jgi:hypothetical protein
MLIAYTDESYIATRYYQAALIINGDDVEKLENVVSQIKMIAIESGVNPSAEIKGYSIMNAQNGWEPLRHQFKIKRFIYRKLILATIPLCKIILIQGLENSISHFESPHLQTYKKLVGNINQFALASKESIKLITDEIGIKKNIENQISDLRISGELSQVASIEFKDSNLTPGIQLVDSILYLFQRYASRQEIHNDTRREVEKLWHLASPITRVEVI